MEKSCITANKKEMQARENANNGKQNKEEIQGRKILLKRRKKTNKKKLVKQMQKSKGKCQGEKSQREINEKVKNYEVIKKKR